MTIDENIPISEFEYNGKNIPIAILGTVVDINGEKQETISFTDQPQKQIDTANANINKLSTSLNELTNVVKTNTDNITLLLNNSQNIDNQIDAITRDLLQEISERKQEDDLKLDKETANFNVMVDLNTNINGDNVYLTLNYKNIATGAASSANRYLPLANDTQAGLMSTADYKQIRENKEALDRIENHSINIIYSVKDNPTAQEINDYIVGLDYEAPFKGISVVVDGTNHVWHYYDNTKTWKDDGVNIVNQFTNEMAGIIKGSNTEGKIYAETDGTGSVVGWGLLSGNVSSLIVRMETADTNIATNASNILQNSRDISDLTEVVDDINTALAERYVKNTDYATQFKAGITRYSEANGLTVNTETGLVSTFKATDEEIEAKESHYKPIVPVNLDKAVKVGVVSNSHKLSEEERTSARGWIGAASKAEFNSLNETSNLHTTEIETIKQNKQNNLIPGENISLDGNVISATDTTYVAGDGIEIVGNVINNTRTIVEWGNLYGEIGRQEDLKYLLDSKVDKEEGKQLSTNDFSDELKFKLGGIEEGAQVNTLLSVNGKTGDVRLNAVDVGALPSSKTEIEGTSSATGAITYDVSPKSAGLTIDLIKRSSAGVSQTRYIFYEEGVFLGKDRPVIIQSDYVNEEMAFLSDLTNHYTKEESDAITEGNVRHDREQLINEAGKRTARTNIDAVSQAELSTAIAETENKIPKMAYLIDENSTNDTTAGARAVYDFVDLGVGATLRETNINVGNLQTELANEIIARENADNLKLDKTNADIDVVNSLSTTIAGDNFYLVVNYKNIKSGVSKSEYKQLSLANDTQAGLMSSADYIQIRQNKDDISRLKNQTISLTYMEKENPTAEEINAFVAELGYESPFNGVSVSIDGTNHVWHYYENTGLWKDDGIGIVNHFTNDIAGIIKGSTEDGKVYAETDGTASVNGWGEIKGNISSLESAVNKNKEDISNNSADILLNEQKIGELLLAIGNNTSEINGLKESKQDNLTAGKGISISEDNVISNTQTTAEWGNLTGDINLQTDLISLLDGKVSKEEGKSLSTNDFTNSLKTKLQGIEVGAQVNTVDSVNGKTGAVVITAGDFVNDRFVTYNTTEQTLTENQKSNARHNINALAKSETGVLEGNWESKISIVYNTDIVSPSVNFIFDKKYETSSSTTTRNVKIRDTGLEFSVGRPTINSTEEMAFISDISNHNSDSNSHSDIREQVEVIIEDVAKMPTKVSDLVDDIGISLTTHNHDDKYSKLGHKHTESDITDLRNYALANHNHDENYAPYQHVHTESEIANLKDYSLVGHTHSYAGSDSVGGAANSAVKLTTLRKINVGGALKGTAAEFDGTADVSISVSEVDGNSIQRYSTKSTSGKISAFERGVYSATRANRLAFLPAEQIKIEHSADGGTTWVEDTSDTTTSAKKNVFAETRAKSLYFGSGTPTMDCQARITIRPWNLSNVAERYCQIDQFYIFMSTTGHGCVVDIECSTVGEPDTFKSIRNNVLISGWPGANTINIPNGTFGGGSSQLLNRFAYRLTFKYTSINSNYTAHSSILDIRGYGDNVYSRGNNYMYNDHLYTWDADQNVKFPAILQANTIMLGEISIDDKYVPKTLTINGKTLTANIDLSYADVNALPDSTKFGKTLEVSGQTLKLKDQDGNELSSVITKDTTYSVATTTTDGLLSKEDKVKLNSVESGATKTLVDSELSTTSTNALQNKIITNSLNSKVNAKPDGSNDLITNNKINPFYIPDYVLGQVFYGGNVNASNGLATLTTEAKGKLGITANTITLTNNTASTTGYVDNENVYFIVTTRGNFANLDLNVGDWLISTGTSWTKIDNTDAVTGVKGQKESTYRLGNVNLTAENIGALPEETKYAASITMIENVITLKDQDGNQMGNTIVLPNSEYINATTEEDGLMSSEDKTKLDQIEVGAQVNKVLSVNSKIGDVVLTSSDVGALPSSKTSYSSGSYNRIITQTFDTEANKTFGVNFNFHNEVNGEDTISGNVKITPEGFFFDSRPKINGTEEIAYLSDLELITPQNVVDLTSNQEIFGEKTFKNKLCVNNHFVFKNLSTAVLSDYTNDLYQSGDKLYFVTNNSADSSLGKSIMTIDDTTGVVDFGFIPTMCGSRIALYSDISNKLPLAGGTMTGAIEMPTNKAILYAGSSGWRSGVYHHTSGDESTVFCLQNRRQGWMFAYTDPSAASVATWTSLTPILQIKNNTVAINKQLGEKGGVYTFPYNLDVNGSANITSIYENGTLLTNKYVTLADAQTITGIKKFTGTAQSASAQVGIYSSSGSGSVWQPRLDVGCLGGNGVVIGNYKGLAGIAGYVFDTSGNGTGYTHLYIQPDGNGDTNIGKRTSVGAWTSQNGIIRVSNADQKAYYNGSEIVNVGSAQDISGVKSLLSNVNFKSTTTYYNTSSTSSSYCFGLSQVGDLLQLTYRNSSNNTSIGTSFQVNGSNGLVTFSTTPKVGSTNVSLVGHTHSISDVSNLRTELDSKLTKLNYEWNKAVNAGQSGYVYIGKFSVYDTNITINISSTTNITYFATIVLATQNYYLQQATVYGDAKNTIAPNIYIKPPAGSSDPYMEVYFMPAAWSKNVINIKGMGVSSVDESTIVQIVTSVPSTATTKPTNALTSNFMTLSTSQTVTGFKQFNQISANTINGGKSGYIIVRETNDSNVIFGSSSEGLRLTTKDARPKVAVNGLDPTVEGNYVELALLSDVTASGSTASDQCVTLTTTQTISGTKTFTGTVYVPDVTIL